MNGIFVTGTDTGVGKTIVTGLLARYLSEKGFKIITQKWIETGCRTKPHTRDYQNLIRPYTFKFPASPHLASKLENRRVNANRIITSFNALASRFDFVIVEGIGGVLVPFNKKRLVIDIARDLSLPVLVVAQNKLGAINHTLLTIEALKRRRIKTLGIVFNNDKEENKYILEDNPRIVKKISHQRILGVLPRRKNLGKLYADFLPIGKRIYKCLRTIGLKKT